MEVKEKSKKRELIKSIAIVFLAVMLLLTFFSNTIMNRSLPEVSTEIVRSGSINAKIRGSGTVTPNEAYDVIIDQTREVRSVCVKVGDTVAQGDLLFVLGDVESQELKDAMEQLQTLNLNYQKQMLSLSKDYASEDRTIQKIQEDLQKAVADRDANLVTDADISYAKGDLAAAESEKKQLDRIVRELEELNNDEEYNEALAAVNELKAEITSLEGKVDGYQSQLDELDSTGSIDMERKIQEAQDAVDNAKRTLKSDWKAYKVYYDEVVNQVKAEYGTEVDGIFDTIVDQSGLLAISSDQQMYLDAFFAKYNSANGGEHPYEDYYDTLLKDYTAITKAEDALEQLREDADIADGSISEQRREIQDKLDEAEADLRRAQRDLRDAEDDLEDAEGGNDAIKEQLDMYKSSQEDQAEYIEVLNEQLTELESKKTVYDAAVETVAAKERELADALSGKDIDKKLDNLDLQALQLDIQRQQELVDKYKEESIDTEIRANVSGTISAINVSAGKDTTSGSPMATIDVVDRGYTMKVPVTVQQSKQVKVGDTADVTNYYWGNDLTATLEAIAPDPAKPGQGKLLIFRVTGEIDPGTNITLSIGQKSASFDAIVPKSALRSDTNGDFVLVMTSKSTPLGNRYYATRVDVQILAQDDTSAAVSGVGASQNEHVITTSSKPLEAGTQVRMVDNA